MVNPKDKTKLPQKKRAMEKQSIQSKKAEIKFREKLTRRQVNGEEVLGRRLDPKGIIDLLTKRMEKTYWQMVTLKKKGVTLSPYIEIGAERGQRALVMENDLNAPGFAVDISFHSLKSCDYYKKVFGKQENPFRICCDANFLPFKTNSIPFIFCYETLHHFPNHIPIVKEVYRVLSPGGNFFFDEEPFKQHLKFPLYKRHTCSVSYHSKKSIFRIIVDRIFLKIYCEEEDYGIVENNDIEINTWRKSLEKFQKKDVKLRSWVIIKIESDLFNPGKNPLFYIINYMLGGNVKGFCQKSGSLPTKKLSMSDVLICPSCLKLGKESDLLKSNHKYVCQSCGKQYPSKENVLFLLPYDEMRELYPSFPS